MTRQKKKGKRVSDAPASRPPGRPKLDIDPAQVEYLASLDCSYEEIAAAVKCSVSLLTKRFSQLIESGRHKGKSSLKRMQFSVAMGRDAVYDERNNCLAPSRPPNPTMLIWLGKIRLGQREMQPLVPTGELPMLMYRVLPAQAITAAAQTAPPT